MLLIVVALLVKTLEEKENLGRVNYLHILLQSSDFFYFILESNVQKEIVLASNVGLTKLGRKTHFEAWS